MMGKLYSFCVLAFVCSLSLSGCGGSGGGESDQVGQTSERKAHLVSNGVIPEQVTIVDAQVDTSTGEITVTGYNFDNGGPPEVSFDGSILTLITYDAEEIIAGGLGPADYSGEHLISVSTGVAPSQSDVFHFIAFSGDPSGPVGQLVVQAVDADVDEDSGALLLSIYGWNFDPGFIPIITLGPHPMALMSQDEGVIEARLDGPGDLDDIYLLLVTFGPDSTGRDAFAVDLVGLSAPPDEDDGVICHPVSSDLCWTNGPSYASGKKKYFRVHKDFEIDLASYLQNAGDLPLRFRTESMRQMLLSQLMGISADHIEWGWDYISLENGILKVKRAYRWDGPSDPRINKLMEFMRSSMVHDALYDFMRLGVIDPDPSTILIREIGTDGWRNRLLADVMFYMLAVEDQRPVGLANAAFETIRFGGASKTRINMHGALRPRWHLKFHAVATAGMDQNLTCGPETVTLDGSASRFASEYLWHLQGTTQFFPEVSPSVPLGLGVHQFTLMADDEGSGYEYWNDLWYDLEEVTVTVNPDETPPVFGPAPDVAVDNDPGMCSAVVDFSVTATDDCDGPLAVTCLPASGSVFAVGTTTVECSATDAGDNTATVAFDVTVHDNEAPTLTVATSTLSVWPPNHKMQSFDSDSFGMVATDNCAAEIAFRDAVSDESDNSNGDGNTTGDIILRDDEVELRAERKGDGNGRVYTISSEAFDTAGNSVSTVVEVHVPHDRHGEAINDAL